MLTMSYLAALVIVSVTGSSRSFVPTNTNPTDDPLSSSLVLSFGPGNETRSCKIIVELDTLLLANTLSRAYLKSFRAIYASVKRIDGDGILFACETDFICFSLTTQ